MSPLCALCCFVAHTQLHRHPQCDSPTMAELRQRKGAAASGTKRMDTDPKSEKHFAGVDTTFGHLGVTLSNGSGAVIIDEVHEADLVYKAGLRAGDVIISVNGTAVSTHEACLKIFDDSKGTTVSVEYLTKAEYTAKLAADKKASRAWWCGWVKSLVKLIVGTLLLVPALSVPIAHAAHRFLPQEKFADDFDLKVLPVLGPEVYEKLGFTKPKMGFDGKPKRRVVPPTDPAKPWTVPGWDRVKEEDAVARLKKTYFYEMRFTNEAKNEGIEDKDQMNFCKDFMEQIRASNGELLKYMEKIDEEMSRQRDMFRAMAAKNGGAIPGMI